MRRYASAPPTRPVTYRVSWLPGSDLLVGSCYCGAERRAADPITIWAWLLAHPDHPAGDEDAP
jgi:hypothetical protein